MHAEENKTYSNVIEKFSDRFDTEYKYFYCNSCKETVYTGLYRMIDKFLIERINMSDKKSVSGKIKNKHLKEKSRLSLKEFARRLVKEGDEIAEQWFDNKHGACDQNRSEKNKAIVTEQKIANKSGKSKDKK